MGARCIRMIIDSNIKDVFLIGLAINKICSEIPLSEVDSYHLEVCVVEACNNAIEHAYDYKPGNEVEVVLELYLDRIEFQISDYGRTMKGEPVSSLDFDPHDREHLPEGSMGFPIIKTLMDKVEYKTQNGKN
ncbi:MAG: ATP-binding protein, partial [bacterium]